MGRPFRLDRRAFLVGAGGTAIGLPLLEIMEPRSARAAGSSTAPCRYVIAMTGTTHQGSLGGGSGTDYTMPDSYESLEPIRDYVTIVDGLVLPQGPKGSIPPGGREVNGGHGSVTIPLATGARVLNGAPSGPSSDQVVADAIGGGTRFGTLQYRVQADDYGSGVGYMSVSHNNLPIGPVASPRLAYDQLFLGFDPGGGGGGKPSDQVLQGASVLDLVLRRSERLRGVLGAWDRHRLEEHFEQIRSLEERVREISQGGGGPDGGGGSCQALGDPGADPTIETSASLDGNGAGWSNETLRGEIMGDLIHMAFVCDLSRVATFMIGFVSSSISMQEVIGLNWDAHSTTHAPFQQAVGAQSQQMKAACSRWFAQPFGRLMKKLHDTPEGSGNMLDSTVGVLLWEHGNPGAHNTTNYVLPIVGSPSTLKQGQRINAGGRHPAHLMQTAMRAIGVNDDFGEAPGVIDELLV